ncbi:MULTISPECIES: N-formylglutamate amidohydrolase [unclassified Herbaspirillum]|uniref:N-formylglutamate amidohydrolase n=1 Tax=unclassified Herbaspirillum TaxID=2624150 RepID=UPI00210F2934|nr:MULTISPECIES: N-formylglutamate amidohydrolase [unclassified Herbaspirillum]
MTCEHGGNRIPAPHDGLFLDQLSLLDSHRGYDAGALLMAQDLATAFDGALVTSTVSRLLVDLNRSVGHPQLFSETIRRLPPPVREEILAQYYRPYREQVEHLVAQAVADGQRVIHISSHSFTPELNGKVRNADVGLLYDPARHGEVELCARWRATLAELAPSLRVRRNYPYAGKGDGLTAYLRQRFAPNTYIGIELEVNQQIVQSDAGQWTALRTLLVDSLGTVCALQV